jgi:hypothetical protein
MPRPEGPDSCPVCGGDLPDDPPGVTVPTGFAVRMTPLAQPGVRRVEFCSERHRRDWADGYRGHWPEDGDGDGTTPDTGE